MSIEQKLDALIAAIEANTAALKGAKGSGSTDNGETEKGNTGKTTTKTTGKTTKTAYEPRHTKAEAQAAANELKEAKGTAAAKAAIKEVGFDKMGDIEKAEDWDKLYDLCKAAMGEGGEEEDI